MGRCNRPRTREFAPTNSGSKTKPERINLRCTTEQCGRALAAVKVAREIRKMRDPNLGTNVSEAFHHVIIPVFEKVVRAWRFGSAAERASASVYLEEFVRREDYIRNRRELFQMPLGIKSKRSPPMSNTRRRFSMTRPQRARFFGLATKAAHELGEDVDEYRHRVMREETGVDSSADLASSTDYERCVARFAADAGDFQAAGDAAFGSSKRKAYLIKVCAMQVMQLKGGDESQARDYVEGVVHQARIPCGVNTQDDSWWMDVAPASLDLVLRILDTERRRMLRRFYRPGVSLKLDDTVRYEIDGPVLVRMGVEHGWYARQGVKVNVV